MKFPLVGDIASTSVVRISIHETLNRAIDMMLESNHRNVVVVGDRDFYILTILDILSIQALKLPLETVLHDISLTKIPVVQKDKNVLETLDFLNSSVEYICVVNRNASLYGILTHTDITSNIDPDTLMENFRLQDFLKLGKRMKWVSKNEKTSTLLEDMINNAFDNVVVVEDAKPIGILTTKDIMSLIKNKSDLSEPISSYMSFPVDTITREQSIKDALKFLKEKGYKRVIVVDEHKRLSGVISQKELISLTYTQWANLMKEYQSELHEINTMLQNQNREYEIIASTDSLTGLYNRHKFSQLYLSAYKTMIQRQNKIAIILLDIDFFKKVNDTFGHNIGDVVLKQVANILLQTLRNVDIVCRWGGEEFVLLIPTANLTQAEHIAQKVRKAIELLELERVGGVTASFGVTEVHEREDMSEVINRADRALYIAKDAGRNCVRVLA